MMRKHDMIVGHPSSLVRTHVLAIVIPAIATPPVPSTSLAQSPVVARRSLIMNVVHHTLESDVNVMSDSISYFIIRDLRGGGRTPGG